MLVEFWDFCRPNSIRTLPYIRGWHERYADAGLQVIGVHTSGFEPSSDPDAVAAVMRLIDRLGFDAVNAGSLSAGVALQPGGPVFGLGLPAERLTTLLSPEAPQA